MSPGLCLVVGLVALFVGAVFAAVQVALGELSRSRLEELAEATGRPNLQKRARAIIDDAMGHRLSVALPRVLFHALVLVAGVMYAAGLAGRTSPTLSDALIGLCASGVVLWAFAVAVPMIVAQHVAEQLVLASSGLVRAWYLLLTPARAVLGVVDEGARRLSGAGEQDAAEALEQELRDVVDEHALGSELGEEEREMLEAVVEFRTTTVEQVMTPRTEIQALEYTDDLEAVKALLDTRGHSRVPVYKESLDKIEGFLYAKDLLRWIIGHGNNGTPFVLGEILRPALFVPESKTVRELLTELLAKRVHIVMVADEYGGTAGLVTIEDIVEEIFGEIADEYEDPEPVGHVVIVEGEHAAIVDARAHIDDANDELEPLGVELPESDEYDTVGGFVVTTLGRIPPAGESFEHAGARVEVLDAEPTRVVRVRVEPLTPAESPTVQNTDTAGDAA